MNRKKLEKKVLDLKKELGVLNKLGVARYSDKELKQMLVDLKEIKKMKDYNDNVKRGKK
jgi:hypothetical protein